MQLERLLPLTNMMQSLLTLLNWFSRLVYLSWKLFKCRLGSNSSSSSVRRILYWQEIYKCFVFSFPQNQLVAVKKASIIWNYVDYIISKDVFTW